MRSTLVVFKSTRKKNKNRNKPLWSVSYRYVKSKTHTYHSIAGNFFEFFHSRDLFLSYWNRGCRWIFFGFPILHVPILIHFVLGLYFWFHVLTINNGLNKRKNKLWNKCILHLSNIKYVFNRNTFILLIDTPYVIQTYICDARCTLVGTTFVTS